MKVFYVVINSGEGTGFIDERDNDNIWTNENPGGYTIQDITGPFCKIFGEYHSFKEAINCLHDYLPVEEDYPS